VKQRVSPAAFELIVRFETGGREYYERKYQSGPHWPGGSSGVTIGCGYDLGHEAMFHTDWQHFLAPLAMNRLARCLGKTGQAGRQALSGVKDIFIRWDAALEVFSERNLPREIHKTLQTFPGAEAKLSADAFGALVSVVFNRGTDLDGPRRREMRNIRDAIAGSVPVRGLPAFIAAEIRSMKRLWTNDPDSDGDLCDRREAEARLVLS
jgi:hypothetical protein